MNFIANESATKLRGGYYTPGDLAGFLARWVVRAGAKDVLEPSCGDGAFVQAMAETPGFVGLLTCFELDTLEAGKAAERAKSSGLPVDLRAEDFLGWALRQMHEGGQRFDAVVGNPPFVRYQYLPEFFQARAERIFAGLGCRFTKHTNAWVPFILASMALLRPGGRLAMVVPSEIIHVLHAQSLRTYLGQQCRRLVVIDPQKSGSRAPCKARCCCWPRSGRAVSSTPRGWAFCRSGAGSSRSWTRKRRSMPQPQSTGAP